LDALFDDPIVLADDRYSRLEAIAWWDQEKLRNSRILVVGAGALGNEVIKNLALLGVGNLVVVDMDRIELSNLCRSVLFRESDQNDSKAECAVRSAKELCPGINAKAITGNVLADLGLGYFKWADLIIGALDNREARVFVNASCARVGRPWLDGGIEVLSGIARGFNPPDTPCYECTMGRADWELITQRRSCSLLAGRAMARGGTPTTPTTASIIGAIQAQEAVKWVHGMDSIMGRGYVFEGSAHGSYITQYSVNPECPWHEPPAEILEKKDVSLDSRVSALWELGTQLVGDIVAIDLGREIVDRLKCPACGWQREVRLPSSKVRDDEAYCEACRAECAPVYFHSISAGSDLLDGSIRDLGIPLRDIVWIRSATKCVGLEIAGDCPSID
jgi:adenylyltransferase/sulfurtransferase